MSSEPDSPSTTVEIPEVQLDPVTEVVRLKNEVHRLNDEVAALRSEQHSVNTNSMATTARVEALEKRFAAMEQRMSHIDHLLMTMQGDVRKLQKELEKTAAAYVMLNRSLGDFRIEMAQRFSDQAVRLESSLETVNAALKVIIERLQPSVIVAG
jgi:chromosome segregation ATPase